MATYLKWELYSHTRPTVPGDYWIATLVHPEGGFSSTVTNFATVPLQAAWHDLAYLLDIAPECLLWYGPLEWPDIRPHAMKRLVKAQQQEFVRIHEKCCQRCGDVTGVNSRSIPYRDQPMDCRKCEAQNSVRIRKKLQAPTGAA